jgi:small subunit ribosomal protein S21
MVRRLHESRASAGNRGGPTIAFVLIGEDEQLEKALKRFKRMVEKEGIVREWKRREYFEKPSSIRNKKNKALVRKREKKQRKVANARNY